MKGTAKIGRVFGPIMLLWFVAIAVLGLSGVVRRPEVILAINPWHAARFIVAHGWQTFVVLGGVFLALTGGEALYADMGHFGRNPIRSSWYAVVLPALLLCYAGQTALLLENPGIDGNPFFKLAPHWAVIPLVVLATCRHDHRQPGDHHRRVLPDPSGDAAWLVPRFEHRADLGPGIRPDLCARDQLGR